MREYDKSILAIYKHQAFAETLRSLHGKLQEMFQLNKSILIQSSCKAMAGTFLVCKAE